jgi:hypothetical protein
VWPAPCRSIGLDWFTKMWARSPSLGSHLLKLLSLLNSKLAERLEELLTSITEALKEKADNLPSRVKDGITIVKRIIGASRLPFEKPVYFLNVCPAKVLRGAEFSEFTDEKTFKEVKDTFGAGNILEYDYPLYRAFWVGRWAGLGCSLVRAMKIPSNVASMSHDSSVGAEPHNYFSLAFNGATFEQRTQDLFGSGRFVAQQIYVMRYPILQTVWGEKGLGLVSEDEIRIQVCARARVVSHVPSQVVCWLQFFVASQVLGFNLLREDMVRKKYPESYTDCGTEEDEQCPKGYPGAQKGSKKYNKVMKFTSAVKMFGKSARKMIAKSRDKKTEAAPGGQQAAPGGQQDDYKCPLGNYAEATAPKPSKAHAKVSDITLLSKTGKRSFYNCKGDASMHAPPAFTPLTPL